MSTRTLIVVPKKGGRVYQIHISLWILLPIVLLAILGGIGLYLLRSNWAPDERQKQQTSLLQRENRDLKKRRELLYSQFDKLQERIREIKLLELEIRKLSGLERNKDQPEGTFTRFFSFVTSPFHSRDEISIDSLLAHTMGVNHYYAQLLRRIETNPNDFERVPSAWPCGEKFTFISFGFGERINPFTGQPMPHLGIDFPAPRGTPVYATARGVAATVEKHRHFGNRVRIIHGNGFVTVYAHLHEFRVRRGQEVRKGQVIGTVGSTGYSTGPHLHYEVLCNEKSCNPAEYLFPQAQEPTAL